MQPDVASRCSSTATQRCGYAQTEPFLKIHLIHKTEAFLRFTLLNAGSKLPTFSSIAETLSGCEFE